MIEVKTESFSWKMFLEIFDKIVEARVIWLHVKLRRIYR